MFATANFHVKVPGSKSPPYEPMRAVRNGWVATKFLMDYGASFPKEVDFSEEQSIASKTKGRLVSAGLRIYAGARACATESAISSPCCKASNGSGGLSWYSSDNCRSAVLTISLHSPMCLRQFPRFTRHLVLGKASRSGRHAPAYPVPIREG